MEPTQEQIKEFWEKYGIYKSGGWWIYPDGIARKNRPPIDLNNLFKYAVPKIQEDGYEITLTYDPYSRLWNVVLFATRQPFKDFNSMDKELEDALFWALKEVNK